MKKILLYILALSLFSCVTLVTYIENIDNYTQFEIVTDSLVRIYPDGTSIGIGEKLSG